MITLLFIKMALISHQVYCFSYDRNQNIRFTGEDGLGAKRTAVHSGNRSAVSSG